ncbi:ornithine carbamoyltransferase [Marininema halotolerans]|uniref:Ornithine carbamoyltransferase n=1 Tax=Marininema halotolerans TaxID=1155944 RepID=A0A1I6PVW9_9BACL|nr:ornithine carbamoyltransferase [Marininema halotolerans]SFS44312.1 ornithine carbamoyltransferase [Marininema halotolerans]
MKRHLITLADLSDQELRYLVKRGVEFAQGHVQTNQPLLGNVIGIYFRKTSTRTRTAFSAAALRLGAQIISYGPNDLQENTGESIDDTTRVLSRMLDGLVARTAGSPQEMKTFASQDRMAVINAMSADEHPTQALTDLTTMHQHFGEIKGLRVLYLGEGNNSAAALALSLSRFPHTTLHLLTPAGYGLSPSVLEQAQFYTGASQAKVIETHDPSQLPDEVDVIYTTRWQTTGTSKQDPTWRDKFRPFSVTEALLNRYPSAIFMHDLPAHRGDEVSAAVLDGPASIAFDQAENKLHSAMATLEWCLGKGQR